MCQQYGHDCGTDSIGTGGTGVTGMEEVHDGRMSTLGSSLDLLRTAIDVSGHSWVCCCCSASCFWRLQISFR